jgi:hypothetical protein
MNNERQTPAAALDDLKTVVNEAGLKPRGRSEAQKKADTEYRKTEKENKYQLHMLLDRRVKDELKMIEWLDQQKAEGRKITDLIKELLLKEAKRKPKNT